MTLSVGNYIYKGTIRHRRFTPFDHFFTYPLFMAYFDISKIDDMLKKSWLWNVNKPSLISFYRKDYHGNVNQSLDEAVRNTVREKTGKILNGPIRILAHLRYFGYCFNPVSFYYCFDKNDQEVELIMAEVTNTPWQERYTYFIWEKSQGKDDLSASLDKRLHVSPFWEMDHDYEWFFTSPKDSLTVNMKNFKSNHKVFDATLILQRAPLNLKNLAMHLLRFPFITFFIVFRIHWQALKLWLKGAPFITHPNKLKKEHISEGQ